MNQVKLNRTIQAEEGDFFKKGSVVEVLTPPDSDGVVEIVPIAAYDTSDNPYPETDYHVYSMILDKTDYTDVPPTKKLSFAFGTPGFDFEAAEAEDDTVSLALKEVYDHKGWIVDRNGYILDKKGARQFQIINKEKVQTDADVVNWVHEKLSQRLNHDTIRQVSATYFDRRWNGLVEAELEKVSEDLPDADKSMTEKAPSKEYLDSYPNKENTKEQSYPIVEAKRKRLQAIKDRLKKKRSVNVEDLGEDISSMSPTDALRAQFGKEGTIIKDYSGHQGPILKYNPRTDEVAIEDATYGSIWISVNDIDDRDGTVAVKKKASDEDKKDTKKSNLQRLRSKFRRRAGEPEEFSYTEKLPDGTNKKQLGDYPDASDESTDPMRTEASVLRLLSRVRDLKKALKGLKVGDKVKQVGDSSDSSYGKTGVVTAVESPDSGPGYVEVKFREPIGLADIAYGDLKKVN